MGGGSKVVGIVSFVVFSVSFFFFILAFSTPWWFSTDYLSDGLWMICGRLTKDSKWECDGVDLGDRHNKVIATAAMMIVALLVNVASLVCYCLTFCADVSLIAGTVLCGVGGLFTLISVSVYGSLFDGSGIGWSFALACTSCCISIVNVIATLVADAVG